MQPCEKKFLYEVIAPNVLYLTIDDHAPIYVGFQHKIRLEVCLTGTSATQCTDAPRQADCDGLTNTTSTLSLPDLGHTLGEEAKLENSEAATTLETQMPSKGKETNMLPLVDENTGRGKRDRKPVLSKDVHREKPIVKRLKRAAAVKGKKSVIQKTEKEESSDQGEEKLTKIRTVRVSDVGWKTSSWKLERMRASRAARKKAKLCEPPEDETAGITTPGDIVSCKFCFKAFASKQELYDHHKIINPPTHVCDICNAAFPFQAYLLVHMKYHSAKKSNLYKCDMCGLDTKNSTGLKRHMIKHTNEKCYKCCICGKESFDFGTSRMHLMTHHKKENKKDEKPDTGSSTSQGLGLMLVKIPGHEVQYTCVYCAQSFPSKNDFFNHARILNQPTYSCEKCGLKFAFRAFLLAHMKIHQEDKGDGKLYTCDQCGLDAKTPTRFKRHMLTHTNEKCYKCCVCLKESPHYGTAKLHLMTHEKKIPAASQGQEVECETTSGSALVQQARDVADDEVQTRSFVCDICNQTCLTKKDLINHNKISNPLTHKCKECGAAFPFRAYLLVHMKSHGKDKLSGTLYKCDECGLNAKNTTRLKRHMITHTKEQCYKCCVCPKTSSCFSTAQKHLMYHRRNGMLRCTCCNTDFPNRQALASHQLAVMEIKCELCGQEFPNRTSRTLHLKSEHPQQILRCHLCLRVYTNQTEFNSHMAYHESNRKKQCPVCGKFVSRMDKHLLSHRTLQEMDESELWMCHKCPMKFKLKSSFIRHLASHSEERNFHCHLCPKAFTSGSELGRHLRRHSSLTPHQCQECGKWFRERRNLKCHMLVHSDSKVFQCSLCPQGFNYKSSLEGHMRSKHAQGTEQEQYTFAEPQVMMSHPEQMSLVHQPVALEQMAPAVTPLHHAASMVQFPVSNWHEYTS
ncbi:zinc finger protein 624 [Elysia marginata]|uniref:Zinc finger protein 624 n=1 Tax=Elysia marginata TaxID=1093978 RepID=A0AAV4EB64_9GAST|nr:zinc finger protein 624 [Elysia marginata]